MVGAGQPSRGAFGEAVKCLVSLMCGKALVSLLASLALLGVAPAGWSSPAVFGGAAIQIQQAPWTVYILPSDPNGLACTGIIVDSLHILTAAHCVYTETGGVRVAPSSFTIDAGVSNIQAPYSTDVQQLITGVASIRVHPGYVPYTAGSDDVDDVAVMTLSAPLDLSGTAVQAVALPEPNSAFPAGMAASVAGFGIQKPGGMENGLLNRLDVTTDPQGFCGASTASVRSEDAIRICASSPTGSVCGGDSGGGLVTTGPTPTLIGILAEIPVSCDAGLPGIYTYVGMPEILDFIQGTNDPPKAPRYDAATLKWRPPLTVGATLTCSSGGWTGHPTLTYTFMNAKTHQVLQKGTRPAYRLITRDANDAVECTVTATNAGGSSETLSGATPTIKRAPG
jgi:secreted trypsin-like serine protease